jgi:hypothetical protein
MNTSIITDTNVAIEHNEVNLLLCLNKLAEQMKANYDKDGAGGNFNITFEFGKKYIKVIKNNWNSSSVGGFVVSSDNAQFPFGTMLKAASFKAPAMNKSRGSIFEIESHNVPWTGIQ